MDDGERPHHAADLVALQPSDEVPLKPELRQQLLLGQGLLQPTLPKGALAKLGQGLNRCSRVAFAHRQQPRCGWKRRTQGRPSIGKRARQGEVR